jgi:Oxidoreductase family, NAD-binding Rossmann fold
MKTTRRSFLRTTSALSAGIIAAGVHSQTCRANPLLNSQMNTAIIGTGGRGGEHISEIIKAPNALITHICEVDSGIAASRASAIGDKQGNMPTIVPDIRKLLEDKSIDVVTIATPNHWHALGGIWAMQAGKHAYIEKPVCYNVQEGAALIATARKHNRMCQVGTQCRSSSACIEAVKFISEGGIGEVKFARGLCYKRRKSIGAIGDYPIPANVDFDLWSGPAEYSTPKVTREKFHYDWHWQRLYGNGDFGNQGPHQTDVARWGLGIDTHPNTILSYGGRLGYQAEREDPNYIDAGDTANTEVSIFDYGDKCIVFETRGLNVDDSADVELNKLFNSTKDNKVGVVFYGSKGYVVQRSYEYCVAMDKEFNVIKEFRAPGALNTAHFSNFLTACEKGDHKLLNADVREGHLSAGLSHLGNISYYLGEKNLTSVEDLRTALKSVKSLDDNSATLDRTVAHLKKNGVDLDKYKMSMGPMLKFDPAKEVFTNNEDANQLLGRKYREGFVCPKPDKV